MTETVKNRIIDLRPVIATTNLSITPPILSNPSTRTDLCRMRTESLPAPSRPPGNGFQTPRDGRPQTAYGRSSFASETARPVFQLRKCPRMAGCSSETGKRRFALDCVVVDAAHIEPVSTSQFPANSEINSVFCRLGPSAAIFASN